MLVQVVYIAYTPLPLHIHHFAKNGVTYTPLPLHIHHFAKNGVTYTPLPLHIHHFAKNGVTYIHILHTYCWKPSNAWHMHTHGVKHSIFTLNSQQPNSDKGVCMHFIYQCCAAHFIACIYISDYVSIYIYCMHTSCVMYQCYIHELILAHCMTGARDDQKLKDC